MSKTLEDIQVALGEAWRQFDSFVDDARLGDLADDAVRGNERLSARQQAEIYREQFWLRHRDALREDYPGLRHVLGDQAFECFCRAYLAAHPPQSFTLRDLGERVAEFAARYEAFPLGCAAVARDMARFELAFVDIFDGPHVTGAEPEGLLSFSEDDWVQATIRLHPQLTLLALDYPVFRVRSALRDGGVPSPSVDPEPTYLAMYRGTDLMVHYRSIDERQYTLLENLGAGQGFGRALSAVGQGLSNSELEALGVQLRQWFTDWASRGWIVAVEQAAR